MLGDGLCGPDSTRRTELPEVRVEQRHDAVRLTLATDLWAQQFTLQPDDLDNSLIQRLARRHVRGPIDSLKPPPYAGE